MFEGISMTNGAAASLGIAAGLAILVLVACATYDTWCNRKKYAAKERERKAQGGLH